MNKERRIIFDLNDIVSIRVKCIKCGTEIVLDMTGGREQYLPSGCSFCNRNWVNDRKESREAALVRLISGHRETEDDAIRLLFELNDGPDGA